MQMKATFDLVSLGRLSAHLISDARKSCAWIRPTYFPSHDSLRAFHRAVEQRHSPNHHGSEIADVEKYEAAQPETCLKFGAGVWTI